MRIAHSAIATPRRCGLYETTRELVAAERALGADARIVNPDPQDEHAEDSDRGVPIADMEWGVNADVIVNHSGFDRTPLTETEQPVIHVAHGRPLSTFMGERAGKAPGLTWQTQRRRKDRYRAAVTFWPEYLPYLENIWAPKPVHCVPPCVDLGYWQPGTSDYGFHGRRGEHNVVMTDPWSREDSSPYHCIHAFAIFQRKYMPRARLHMLAWDGNKKGLTGISNVLGEGGGMVTRWASDVRRIFHAADMLITPHRIYTRSIREAMACGLQVVSGRECHPEDVEGFADLMHRRRLHPLDTRCEAGVEFDPLYTAREFLDIVAQHAPAGVT